MIWRTSNTAYQSLELGVSAAAFNLAAAAAAGSQASHSFTWDNPPGPTSTAWAKGPWLPANNSNVEFVRWCLENSLLLMDSEYEVGIRDSKAIMLADVEYLLQIIHSLW